MPVVSPGVYSTETRLVPSLSKAIAPVLRGAVTGPTVTGPALVTGPRTPLELTAAILMVTIQGMLSPAKASRGTVNSREPSAGWQVDEQ